jgi:hypothetical protein
VRQVGKVRQVRKVRKVRKVRQVSQIRQIREEHLTFNKTKTRKAIKLLITNT